MNTLKELIQNKQYMMNRAHASEKNSQNEAFVVFNALTLKEKCLYLMKISKRKTDHQTLVLMVLTLLLIAANYLFSLFSMII